MRKVVPSPGADCTSMCPPCCSTIPNTIARPRPVPPSPLVVKNGSNTRAWTSALMPTPGIGHLDDALAVLGDHAQADRAAVGQRIDRIEDEIGQQLAQPRRATPESPGGPRPRCAD